MIGINYRNNDIASSKNRTYRNSWIMSNMIQLDTIALFQKTLVILRYPEIEMVG